MRQALVILLSLLLICVPLSRKSLAEDVSQPAVVWFSAPVGPGETAMVHGAGWAKDTTVLLDAEAGGEPGLPPPAAALRSEGGPLRKLRPVNVTPTCVSFVVPKGLPQGSYQCRIESGGKTSDPFVLNEPGPWWVQGDWGREASPDGWVRVLGRCLSFGGRAKLVLKNGNRVVDLKLDSQDQWALAASLPAELSPGLYDVFVHNGYGGAGGWRRAGGIRIAPHEEVWQKQVFDVRDYGAVPNDRVFDTPAVKAALDAAANNGGGIVYFPRGRYQITATLEVPRFTLLRGEALELSQLYWPDTEAPPEALIRGSDSFGIQALFISAGNYLNGIVSESRGETNSGNITLRRLRVRLLRDQYVSAEERVRRDGLPGFAFRIAGDFVRVEDCDCFASGSMNFTFAVRNSIIARNSFRDGGGYLAGCENLIFERNLITNGANSLGPGRLYSRNLYWAQNRVERNFKHDREAMTLDGGGHSYQGVLAACESTRMTLAPKRMAWRHGPAHWINGGTLVMDGRGAGQLRRIRSIDNNVVEIDRPWTIEPDGESKVMISCFRERHIFAHNHIEDATVALQLYGSMIECVVASNTCARAGGFHSYGMYKGGGPEPSWFVQFLDNEILEGNAYRGPQNEIPACDSHLAIRDRGYPKARFPFTRTCLARRCVLHNNARLEVLGGGSVANALIENCVVRNADVGLHVSDRARGVILRGNRFENVREPLTGAIRAAVTHPADMALAALNGASTWLRDAPPAWAEIRKQLEEIANAQPIGDEALVRTRQLVATAVVALAKQEPPTLDATVMAVLLGLQPRAHTHTLLPVLARAKGGPAKMLMTFALAEWAVPVQVAVKPGTLPGWSARAERGARLKPGESGRQHLHFEIPPGRTGRFRLPLAYEVRGDGWRLTFKGHIDLGSVSIGDWLIAGPFVNESGKTIDETVHPPERKLDIAAKYETRDGLRGWLPAAVQKGTLDLSKQFDHTDKSVAYGVTCVRARKPIAVKLTYNGRGDGLLLYANGQRIGTRWRFNQWGCTTLNEGDNIIRFISTNINGAWRVQVRMEPLVGLLPGDLYVLPADELASVPALRDAGEPTPEGKTLPHSLGLDWKLVFEDSFNRDRLGTALEGRSDVHWRSSEWKIEDGHVLPQQAWTTLAYADAIKPPVRIEYDVFSTTDGVRMLGTMLCPRGLSKHRFWGRMYGHGYFLSLGWHNRFSNSVMRNDKEVLVDEKGVLLKQDRWYHVVAQFVPGRCQLYLDGKLVIDYRDESWIEGLNEIALYSYPVHWFDNLRIYEVRD